MRAYEHLHQFAGRAKFSTWLTRIAKCMRLWRDVSAAIDTRHSEPVSEGMGEPMDGFATGSPNPEQQASNDEMRTLLKRPLSNCRTLIEAFSCCATWKR